jgi:tagaturonate reductase
MILSKYTLKNITAPGLVKPEAPVFELPEKLLQFGTGVLLRGLPDYFIDKANRQGIFNGRIVVVKSTNKGDSSSFEKQDGLYTQCVRGIENGKKIEENIINASISRVLSSATEWAQVLECAHNRDLQVIVSNTTEVGIQFVNDDIRRHPPVSFPGKLLAFLYERFRAFGGSAHSGMVIIPTELIVDNGRKLEAIVLELAHLNGLEDEFISWLEEHNCFCNSLVDRIVPGKPDADQLAEIEKQLGYSDNLLIMSEAYKLWAIEGDEHVKNILSFAKVDQGVVITKDINSFRELKLRLLNGAHTLSCGIAFLAGLDTVKEAMDDIKMSSFISELMMDELIPSIPYDVEADQAIAFGKSVLDRFRNPEIRHQWINITVQYSSKMKMRCLPVLLKHYRNYETVPELFAFGFAAYLAFMKPVALIDGVYYGEYNGKQYPIQDDQAGVFYKRWAELGTAALTEEVLRDNAYWEEDLHALPEFNSAVVENLEFILNRGMKEALERIRTKQNVMS